MESDRMKRGTGWLESSASFSYRHYYAAELKRSRIVLEKCETSWDIQFQSSLSEVAQKLFENTIHPINLDHAQGCEYKYP